MVFISYCFNQVCPNPQNLDESHCLSCGSLLLLHNRYRGISILGRGGCRRTFLGVDERDRENQFVVIKQVMIQDSLTFGIQPSDNYLNKAIDLFFKEAEALQSLGNQPQLPAVIDYFEERKQLYLVQEFIEGENLLEELKEEGVFKIKKIEKLLKELLPAISNQKIFCAAVHLNPIGIAVKLEKVNWC